MDRNDRNELVERLTKVCEGYGFVRARAYELIESLADLVIRSSRSSPR